MRLDLPGILEAAVRRVALRALAKFRQRYALPASAPEKEKQESTSNPSTSKSEEES